MPTATEHRQSVQQVSDLAIRDLAAVWADFDSATVARDRLLAVLPRLILVYATAAAVVAADFYDDLRDEAGVRGRFRAIPAELPDPGRAESLARWGVGPLFADEPDFAASLSRVSGGLQRVIANADRHTVAGSAVADPGARGWQRVGVGTSCDFCQMLLSRGAVYTEATAQFEAHDHCNCGAEPVFR